MVETYGSFYHTMYQHSQAQGRLITACDVTAVPEWYHQSEGGRWR